MVLPAGSLGEQVVVKMFVLIPFVALVGAVPIAWGWGLGWTDLGLAAGFYVVACLGATVGYHRYFTHRAFTATRGLRNAWPAPPGPSPSRAHRCSD